MPGSEIAAVQWSALRYAAASSAGLQVLANGQRVWAEGDVGMPQSPAAGRGYGVGLPGGACDVKLQIVQTEQRRQAARVWWIGGPSVVVRDVRLKRVDLPQEVSESVYTRMRAERTRAANMLRSEGAAESEKIRADADRQREVILAKAYRDAQRLKGEGDAKAASIYARAYEANPEFYAFYRSLDAYKSGFKGKSDVLVLDPNSDFFKYFKSGGRAGK